MTKDWAITLLLREFNRSLPDDKVWASSASAIVERALADDKVDASFYFLSLRGLCLGGEDFG
jgi:hypothetical protein